MGAPLKMRIYCFIDIYTLQMDNNQFFYGHFYRSAKALLSILSVAIFTT